jgi:hypothetical protein
MNTFWYFLCISAKCGIAALQGGHQVAKHSIIMGILVSLRGFAKLMKLKFSIVFWENYSIK